MTVLGAAPDEVVFWILAGTLAGVTVGGWLRRVTQRGGARR